MALTVKRPEKRVDVCLDGTLVAEHEALAAELEDKRKRKLIDPRMVDPVQELAERVRAIEEAAKDSTVTFLLRAISRREWDGFVDAHPPREDNEIDKAYGFNTSTLFDEVLAAEGTIVSVTHADGKAEKFTPADWAEFADSLTSKQYEEFQVAVTALNRGRNEVPFSLAAYRETQASGKS